MFCFYLQTGTHYINVDSTGVCQLRISLIRKQLSFSGMEFVGPPKRLYAAQIGMFFWVGGTMIMAGFSYFIRNWSTFQIVCAVPGVLLISYW